MAARKWDLGPATPRNWILPGRMSLEVNPSPHPPPDKNPSGCQLDSWHPSLVQVCPAFRKVHVMPLRFYERPTLVPVFANRKKSEEDFRFYEKRQKVNTAFGVCFVVRGALPSPFPGNHAQHLSLKPPELWTVSVSICCISIYFVHLLVRCLLR